MPIWPSSLYLPRLKALVLAGQQLVGLPTRDEAGLDQEFGQAVLIFERSFTVLGGRLFKKARKPSLFHETASPQQLD